MPPIILASASPRRCALMAQAGIPCRVLPCDADETVAEGTSANEAVQIISARKAALALAQTPPPAVIVAADTIVCLGRRVLGKPRDAREAHDMLKMLQGQTHTVYTGVTLIESAEDQERTLSFTETARVTMRALTDAQIDAYVSTGEPLDKAGAYGLQGRGSVLVARIEGDCHAVVGLPLARLCAALAHWGIDIMTGWEEDD